MYLYQYLPAKCESLLKNDVTLAELLLWLEGELRAKPTPKGEPPRTQEHQKKGKII
jgi:hypothetical protein